MPRIRSLKPEHRQHRKVGPLDHVTYRLWVGMICEADDEGRLIADPEQLRVLIFGFRPEVTAQTVTDGLVCLQQVGLIRLYTVQSTQFAAFTSWIDHQRINRPTPSKLPPYKESARRRPHGGLTEPSRKTHAGSDLIGEEGKGSDRRGAPQANNGLSARPIVVFKIPSTVVEALERAPILGQVAKLRDPLWWQAELRANDGVDLASEVYKAEAWLKTNPGRAPKSNHARFMHSWLARADREVDES